MGRCFHSPGYILSSGFAGSDGNFMFNLVMLVFCLFILSVQFWYVAGFFFLTM